MAAAAIQTIVNVGMKDANARKSRRMSWTDSILIATASTAVLLNDRSLDEFERQTQMPVFDALNLTFFHPYIFFTHL